MVTTGEVLEDKSIDAILVATLLVRIVKSSWMLSTQESMYFNDEVDRFYDGRVLPYVSETS